MAIYCMNCGASLPDGVAFCDACGTPVRGQSGPTQQPAPVSIGSGGSMGSVACSVCGAAALPGEAFCDNCGAALLPSNNYAPAPPVSAAAMSPASMPVYNAQPVQSRASQGSFVITNPPPPATLQIPDRPDLIVGRSDPQSNSYPDLDLGPYGGLDLGVSRRHFRLTRAGDQFYIEDLGAVNGTVINGQRIPPHTLHPLRPGDNVALGKMAMTFDLA